MSPESPFSPEKESKVKQRWTPSLKVKIARVHNVISSMCDGLRFPADPVFAVNAGSWVPR